MAADEEIVLDIKINGDKDIQKSVNSLKNIKNEIKSLKAQMLDTQEGSKAFVEIANKLGSLQDKLAATNEAAKTLAGNGIENVNSSFASLSQAFQTADFTKIKTSFKTLGQAINGSTIILSAIIAVVTYVIQNFDELSKKAGLLGTYLRALASVFEFVTQAISDFTDWLGLTNNALEKSTAKTIEEHQKQLTSLTDRYDKEIELAKKAGKDTTEIEIRKSNAIIDNARLQLNVIRKLAEANGSVSSEQMKQIEALSKIIKDAGSNIELIRVEQRTKQQDNDKKHLEKLETQHKQHIEKLKAAEKGFEDFKNGLVTDIQDQEAKTDEEKLALKKQREIDQLNTKLDKLKESGANETAIELAKSAGMLLIKQKYDNEEKVLLDKKSKAIDDFYFGEATKKIKADEDDKTLKEKADLDWYAGEADKAAKRDKDREAEKAKRDKDREAEKAKQKKVFNDSLQGAQSLNNALAALSDGLFAAKTKNLTKGSEAEKAVLKKQFNVQKGFSIANAVISGIQGAISAFNSLAVIPIVGTVLGAAAAAVVGVSTALQVKKIASTKFDDGGSASGGDTSVPTPNIPSADTAPTPQTPTMNLTNTGESGTKTLGDNNNYNNNNTQTVIKAFVVEQDITDSQKRQASIDQRSTL